jgi:hypothetical protein
MKIWIEKPLSEEHVIDALNVAIYDELVSAGVITRKPNGTFTEKRYHPTKPLVAAHFKINKIAKWKKHILKHINESDLVELGKGWDGIGNTN